MPFTSAELKTLAELAWAEGIPLSASQAGHYFHYGQLATLVDQAIDIARDRRAAADAYWIATKDRTRLRTLAASLPPLLAHAIAQRDHYTALYRTTMAQIAVYDDLAYQIASLEREIIETQYRYANANTFLYEAEDYLAEAIDERDTAYDNIDEYEFWFDYWETYMIYNRRAYEECEDDEDCPYSEAMDLRDEWEYSIDRFDAAGELYENADDEYAYWRREVWDLEDKLAYYEDTVADVVYDLRWLTEEIADLRSQAGNIGQLTTDRYYYQNLYRQWGNNVFTYTANNLVAQQSLARAEATYITTLAKVNEMNAMYERMIDRWW